MRVLAVTSRFPERNKRGDQSRAFGFLSFLARRHEVTVVSAAAPSSRGAFDALAESCTIIMPRVTGLDRARSALATVFRDEPAQVGWMMPSSAWRVARSRALSNDVVLVNTVRSLRGPFERPLVVDYIDALSWNMAVRARGPEALPIRGAAFWDAGRLRRWESKVARWATCGITTTKEVAETLPGQGNAAVIPVALQAEVVARVGNHRDIDVILTGDMRYPPNREAAGILAREIMPVVRGHLPGTTCWIVGRHAASVRLKGVEVRSDVDNVAAFLRRAKLAIAPVRGRGSLYKVLEAAANGAAIVAPAWALDAYGLKGEVASTPAAFGEAAARLLANPVLRERRAAEALAVARAHSLDVLGPRYEAVLDAALRGDR
jgi:hypothetical protein